ncbi:hypothetical protein M153_3230003710 [Pseudoloma neurophilia]|uniref:Uncharacterized protein n=1 Tax=Pseudoloma neurophilia TaxID=146866 RepID=A0A0R0M5P6_9MICR|nr:hypothetical protein M153_3230003710 [Pseudoloma neurophilia]
MSDFNKQLARKMLMMFFAYLQLIGSKSKVKGANTDSIPPPSKTSNDLIREDKTQNNELNIRHFIPLSLSSDKTSDCVEINFLTKEVAHGVDVTNESVKKASFEFLKDTEKNNNDESVRNFCTRLNEVLPRHENDSSRLVFVEFPCLEELKNSCADSFYIGTVTQIKVECTRKKAAALLKIYIPRDGTMTIDKMLEILFPGTKFIIDIIKRNVFFINDEHYKNLKYGVLNTIMRKKVITPDGIEKVVRKEPFNPYNLRKTKQEKDKNVECSDLQNEKSLNSSNTTPMTHEENNPNGKDNINDTPSDLRTQEETTSTIATKTQESSEFEEKYDFKYKTQKKKDDGCASDFYNISVVLSLVAVVLGIGIL